ncbi:MAG TPA: hypothetical protein VJB02_02675, partial [Coxiellaceae bacterium]|nr:hypothetical protein [Coxiellaceae bacterium]
QILANAMAASEPDELAAEAATPVAAAGEPPVSAALAAINQQYEQALQNYTAAVDALDASAESEEETEEGKEEKLEVAPRIDSAWNQKIAARERESKRSRSSPGAASQASVYGTELGAVEEAAAVAAAAPAAAATPRAGGF